MLNKNKSAGRTGLPRVLYLGVPALVFVASIIFAKIEYLDREEMNREKVTVMVSQAQSRFADQLFRAIRQYEYGLTGLKGAFQAIGPEQVDHDAILAYTAARDYKTEFPGALGFGFIRYVEADGRDRFLEEVLKARGPGFKIRQLTAHDEALFVILYIEPEADNRQAVGLDIGSEKTRRSAAMAAAMSRKSTLTGPITLVQADQQALQGFLLLNPLFIKDDATSGERLYGWIYAPLLISQIVEDNRLLVDGFTIQVFDTNDDQNILILDSATATPADEYAVETNQSFFGRDWRISFTPDSNLIAQQQKLSGFEASAIILQVGLLFSALIFAFLSYLNRKIQVNQQKLQIASLMNVVSEGVISIDANFVITGWNQSADRIFGLSEMNARYHPLFDCLTLGLDFGKTISIQKQVASGQEVKGESSFSLADDEASDRYRYTLQPITDKDLKFVGATFSVIKLDNIKGESDSPYFADGAISGGIWQKLMKGFSFDLRVSLNLIKGALDLLQLSELSPSQRLSLQSGASGFIRAIDEIDNLSETVEISSGEIVLNEEPVFIDDLLDDVSGHINQYAEENNVEIHYVFSDDMPLQLKIDRRKTRKLILNTLAILARRLNNKEIIVAFSGRQEAESIIRIDVSASIPDESASKDEAMSDLNLNSFVTARIAGVLDGDFNVPGSDGRLFELTFRGKDPGRVRGFEDLYKSGEEVRVLIVDDSDVSTMTLSASVLQLGWEAVSTNSASSALRILKEYQDSGDQIDIILLDWKLPDMDGWVLAEKIRSEYGGKSPAIVMITAYNMELLSRAHNRTPDMLNGYLTKPVTRLRLVEVISQVLALPMPMKSLFQEMAPVNDLKGVQVLLVEDNLQNQLVLKKILEEYRADVVVAPDAETAIAEAASRSDIFDVVLMDIQLPDINGCEATLKMREIEGYRKIPVIAVTANASSAQKKECEEFGMDGYIEKPFSKAEMLSVICRHLVKVDIVDRPFGRDQDQQLPVVNVSENNVVLEFCAKHHIDYESAIDRFAHSLDIYIFSLKNFANELEKFKEYIKSEEVSRPALQSRLHALKGTAGTMGFVELYRFLKDSEKEAANSGSIDQLVDSLWDTLNRWLMVCEEFVRIMKAECQTEGGDGVDYSGQSPEFDENIELLRNEINSNNMAALQSFRRVKSALMYISPDKALQIENALYMLQFKQAHILLDSILNDGDKKVRDAH